MLLLFGIVSHSLTASSRQSSEDSTRLYSVPIWQVWRLVAMAQRALVCDTLVRYQEQVISLGIRTQASTDSVMILTEKELVVVQALAGKWEEMFNIQFKLTAVEIKQKKKWVIIAVAAIILVIVETTLVILGSSR